MATEGVPSPTAPLTTKQAAATIVEPINARPASPRQDEIEAIIAHAVAPAVPPLSGIQTQLLAPGDR